MPLRRRKSRRFAAFLPLLLLFVPASAPAASVPNRRSEIVGVVDRVGPAVVNISAEKIVSRRRTPMDLFFDPLGGGGSRSFRTQSLGSGVVVDPKGIVLTNNHVIAGASRILCTFSDGRELPAEVVGTDADNDLAVLRIEGAKGLPAVELGRSNNLLIGETVIAIGNPLGLASTVTTGVLSAVGRTVKEGERVYTDFLQTDAAINPGNSGGPLVNIEGDLIGINTAIIASAQGIGFAIPIDRARKVMEDLIRFGEVRPVWTGLRVRTLTPEMAARLDLKQKKGAVVVTVRAGSPADAAGLEEGDVIVRAAGRLVDGRDTLDTALSSLRPGQNLDLSWLRDGRERTGRLRVETAPKGIGPMVLAESVGISVAERGGKLPVVGVTRRSAAEEAGLEKGDLLLAVDGQKVRTIADLDKLLEAAANRGSVALVIERAGWAYNLTFDLD